MRCGRKDVRRSQGFIREGVSVSSGSADARKDRFYWRRSGGAAAAGRFFMGYAIERVVLALMKWTHAGDVDGRP